MCSVVQSCPTLWGPMGCSPPGSFAHDISQARILEWGVISSSRGIFPTQGLNSCLLCLLHWEAGSLPLAPPGKPCIHTHTHTHTHIYIYIYTHTYMQHLTASAWWGPGFKSSSDPEIGSLCPYSQQSTVMSGWLGKKTKAAGPLQPGLSCL